MTTRRLEDYGEPGRSVPRYELLKRLLLDELTSAPPECEFLPYETELMARYHLARNTVRRALAKLRWEGYIETRRHSGSRILKRSIVPYRPVLRVPGFSGCAGILLANDTDDPNDKTNQRWQFVDAIEKVFARAGIRVAVFNLREKVWDFPKNPEKLAAALAANGIRKCIWINPSNTARESLRQLLRGGIKLILVEPDLSELGSQAHLLRTGCTFTAVDTLGPIEQVLEQEFLNCDRILYAGWSFDLDWQRSRAGVCRDFAADHGIDFRAITLTEPGRNARAFQVTEACAREFRKNLEAARRVAVFAANDKFARDLLVCCSQTGGLPSNFTVIGFDNTEDSRELGFSTFDIDDEARGAVLLSLYGEVTDEIRGLITRARFIRRPGPLTY